MLGLIDSIIVIGLIAGALERWSYRASKTYPLSRRSFSASSARSSVAFWVT